MGKIRAGITTTYKLAMVLSALMVCRAGVCAQLGTAQLSGVVSDSTGAAIPDAQVVLRSATEQASREAVANSTGEYVIPAILPGTYQLTVKKPGFQTETLTNIVLTAGQGSTLNVTLSVGRTLTQVEIKEAPPLLQTTTSSIGNEVTATQFVEFPTLGRSFQSLLQILPGVAYIPPPNGANFSIGSSSGEGGINPSVYGERNRDNNYSIDGVPNNVESYNGIPTNPPPEAIGEMKVETGTDSGAYGWSAGATISLVTKSGTNQYHGDLWEFLQNNDLDARSYFLPSVGGYKWNQFGGTFGGPLVIPHLLSKQKAWYVFGWYEGVRNHYAANFTGLVPTAAERQGNFAGDPTIYNPYTTTLNPNGSVASRQVFPNNQISTSLINSSALAIANLLYPLPNLPPGVIPGVNYLNVGADINTADQYSGRIDHQFGQKDSFYARLSDARNPQSTIGLPALPAFQTNHFTNGAVSETHTLSPTALVTFRFGMERTNPERRTGGPNILAAAGMVCTFPPYRGKYPLMPPICISGYPGLSQGVCNCGPEFLYSWTADAQKIKGRHALAFGGRITRNTFFTDCLTGVFECFAPAQTAFAPCTGDALASYLLGLPEAAGRLAGNTAGDDSGNEYSYYVQDTFRASPKLTVNLGLRWDFAPVLKDHFGSSTFEWETGEALWDIKNPITGAPANVRRGGAPPDYRGYQPRVGIAYSVTPRTVVRSSYGTFSEAFGVAGQSQESNHGNWPFAFAQTEGSLNLGLPTAFIQDPFPGPPVATPASEYAGLAEGMNFWPHTTRMGYVQEWNFTIQRQFTPSLMLELAYVGSHGVKLPGQIIDNTAEYPGTDPYQDRQRWPNFPPYINNNYCEFSSDYNGMSVKLEKRTSRNLSFLITFTWQKILDDSDSTRTPDNAITNMVATNPTRFNLGQFWGPASFDLEKIFNASYTYQIPFHTGNRLANGVLANWSLSGNINADGGAPYFVYIDSDNENIGEVSGRLNEFPNFVGSPNNISQRTASEWFNTAAFQLPAFGTAGDGDKHALFSDPLINWNAAFEKRWPFREQKWLEFRAEFFNFLNQSTFAPPDDLLGTPQFGEVSSTRQGGRTIQFALKLHF